MILYLAKSHVNMYIALFSNMHFYKRGCIQ
uniref:Uncharacterized protein n=1 Tax=Anguilla anguilla TaxID=7936 RepID=A0A0E9PUJ9_ANGAN